MAILHHSECSEYSECFDISEDKPAERGAITPIIAQDVYILRRKLTNMTLSPFFTVAWFHNFNHHTYLSKLPFSIDYTKLGRRNMYMFRLGNPESFCIAALRVVDPLIRSFILRLYPFWAIFHPFSRFVYIFPNFKRACSLSSQLFIMCFAHYKKCIAVIKLKGDYQASMCLAKRGRLPLLEN